MLDWLAVSPAELRIVVNYDPENVMPDPPPLLDGGVFDEATEEDYIWYEPPPTRSRYAAWPAGFPWAVGDGPTVKAALCDLAKSLRKESGCASDAGVPPKELLSAARQMTCAELVTYLESLSDVPVLDDAYGLVLR